MLYIINESNVPIYISADYAIIDRRLYIDLVKGFICDTSPCESSIFHYIFCGKLYHDLQ
jgi:hypothetical protein